MTKANDQRPEVPEGAGAQTAAERGRQVRGRLLAAAAELIAERGWHAVSTRQVAERAGVVPGLVHYHFSSLPALLRQAATDTLREIVRAAADEMAAADSAEDAVLLMLRSLDAYDGRDPASLLAIEAFLAATRDDELRADLTRMVGELRGMLAARLSAAGDPDPHGTAAVLAAAVDGMMLHRALSPDLTSAVVAPVLQRLLPTPKEIS